MADDIVTRLRWIVEEGLYSRGSAYDDTLINAADEIERLRAERDDWQSEYLTAFLQLGFAVDEIANLRVAGDALAALVRDLGPGGGWDAALGAWEEARRG